MIVWKRRLAVPLMHVVETQEAATTASLKSPMTWLPIVIRHARWVSSMTEVGVLRT